MTATKLELPAVTLCAATSVNVGATIAALRACLDKVDFADCVLLTDAEVTTDHPSIRIEPIARLNSSRDYSDFILTGLRDYVRTSHCLIVQWDGFVLDADRWDPAFLDVDYIGAPWPQFNDGHAVGNGGFSLRSRKLLEACRDPNFEFGHPEDVAICRVNRRMLEQRFGLRFADCAMAGRFAYERATADEPTFGFHGVFNFISEFGPDRFWQVYKSLDHRVTTFADFHSIIREAGRGPHALRRQLRLTSDWLRHLLLR